MERSVPAGSVSADTLGRGHRPKRRGLSLSLSALACALALVGGRAAQAEVSAQDGYSPSGAYQVHVELIPYAWVPAVSGNVKLGSGASANISQGIPSLSQITSALTGAFIGAGLLRYGPWSGEIDIQYVGISQTKDLSPDLLGQPRSLKLDASLVRVAPGFGYEVYKGALGGIPATLDVRLGFAWFSSSTTLDLDRSGLLGRERVSSLSYSGSFTQPWAGLRGAIYPWPRWRFELGAVAQGFGVGGGVWGWGTTVSATWAATRWLNLIAAFRAINSSRNFGSDQKIRSISLTAYGPALGISISF